MNNQNLLIYESQILYEILIELSDHLNFKVVNISKKELDGDHKDFYVNENTIDALFSYSCDKVIDQVLRQHKW